MQSYLDFSWSGNEFTDFSISEFLVDLIKFELTNESKESKCENSVW